jgi:hypothetical protein
MLGQQVVYRLRHELLYRPSLFAPDGQAQRRHPADRHQAGILAYGVNEIGWLSNTLWMGWRPTVRGRFGGDRMRGDLRTGN